MSHRIWGVLCSYSYYMPHLPKTNERPRKSELMQLPSVKNSAGIKGKHSQSFYLFQIILLTMNFKWSVILVVDGGSGEREYVLCRKLLPFLNCFAF